MSGRNLPGGYGEGASVSPEAQARQMALVRALLAGRQPAAPQRMRMPEMNLDPRLAKQQALVQALRQRPPVQPL